MVGRVRWVSVSQHALGGRQGNKTVPGVNQPIRAEEASPSLSVKCVSVTRTQY